MATPQEILEQLKKIQYPGYTRDIVSFGMIRDIEVGSMAVTVVMAPGGAKPEAVEQIKAAVIEQVRQVADTDQVEIVVQQDQSQARRATAGPAEVRGIRHIVAVASGKGGVGKSTVAVNLTLALKAIGYRAGLLDADVYGPSVPTMLGLHERPRSDAQNRIEPLEKFGIKTVSLGLFVEERTPIIWRGPMINKLLTQFLREVEWGELDHLVIDLPPGTGDAQLTIVQQVPLAGGVIVTTPQEVALLDVQRGIKMFDQVNAPVLGLLENMSYHVCSGCGDRAEIFGHGGGARMARELGIPFLGEIPLLRDIRASGDAGEPIVASHPESPHSKVFLDVAQRVATELEKRGGQTLPLVH